MKSARTIFFVALVLFLCACPAIGTIHFNDGLPHDINYVINDYVRVDYQTPEMYTTVNWRAGGFMDYPYWLRGYEHSRINVRGGSINELHSFDSSQVDISGGEIEKLRSHDSSLVNISSGTVWQLYSFDASQVYVSGGSMKELVSLGSSQFNISGGSVDSLGSNESSQVNMSGGSIHYLQGGGSSKVDISAGSIDGAICSVDSGQVNIYGGSIEYIQSHHSSQVNVYGGTIGGGNLALLDQSLVQIFGYDFAVDGQPFGYGELTSIFGGDIYYEPLRHLTGTLLSSELIDNDFYIGHDAKIVLVPEPTTLLLLGLGGLALRKRRR